MGQYNRVQQSGFYFSVPMIEKIAYVVDMREKSIPIAPLSAITGDNVSLGGPHADQHIYIYTCCVRVRVCACVSAAARGGGYGMLVVW